MRRDPGAVHVTRLCEGVLAAGYSALSPSLAVTGAYITKQLDAVHLEFDPAPAVILAPSLPDSAT